MFVGGGGEGITCMLLNFLISNLVLAKETFFNNLFFTVLVAFRKWNKFTKGHS